MTVEEGESSNDDGDTVIIVSRTIKLPPVMKGIKDTFDITQTVRFSSNTKNGRRIYKKIREDDFFIDRVDDGDQHYVNRWEDKDKFTTVDFTKKYRTSGMIKFIEDLRDNSTRPLYARGTPSDFFTNNFTTETIQAKISGSRENDLDPIPALYRIPKPSSTSGARASKGKKKTRRSPPDPTRRRGIAGKGEKLTEKQKQVKRDILGGLIIGGKSLEDTFEGQSGLAILDDMIATRADDGSDDGSDDESDDKPTKPKPSPGKARALRLARRSARTLDTDAYAVALKM